jgi:predicted ATP-dependent endonuclease of OLD family
MKNILGDSESYFKTIKSDYFLGLDGVDYSNIYTGQNLYVQLLEMKNHEEEKSRNNYADFQNFIHKTFFNTKQQFEIIPVVNKNALTKINFGKNDEFALPFIGDGIQALILILYPIFLKQGEKALFFIEEPELNLHPGMQRVFLETLMDERFKDMQFFFTTHSNHFLDLTLETDKISVYHFNKTKDLKFEVKNKVHGDENILKSLGVRNSSVFLSNCTIWVE